jgi:hypothetical protein
LLRKAKSGLMISMMLAANKLVFILIASAPLNCAH